MPDYDVLIAGAGPVGAALACALRGHEQGLRLAMVEARPTRAQSAETRPDTRRLALSYGSRCILDTLGVWSALSVGPIHTVHISQQGSFGRVRLRHSELGFPALGYLIAAQELEQALWQRLDTHPNLDLLRPASIEHISLHPEAVQVTVVHPDRTRRTLSTRLLVAADGGRSVIREQLGIPVLTHDYRQTAILADISLSRPHRQTAYERFTDHGVFALLPLPEQRATLVHAVASERLEAVLALGDGEFADYVSAAFNGRLPTDLDVGPRQCYPLHLVKARRQTRHRCVLIGNAAHTLHPVAGQGLNLGLRDAAFLAERIAAAQATGRDIGSTAVLEHYAADRHWDQHYGLAFTDGLVRLFDLPGAPLRVARSLGLGLFDLLPPAKRLLARYSMGVHGRQTRLARGLPLSNPTETPRR